MKRFLVPVLLFFLLPLANAIVIVPPIVYFATISILSVAFNLFVGLFFWIAVQGVATKKFFGKPLHEVLAFVLGSAGKLLFAVLLTVLLIFVVSPLEITEIFFTAGLAALLFCVSLFLTKFRIIRNSKNRRRLIAGIGLFSAVVFAIIFFSILLSVVLVSVSTGEEQLSAEPLFPAVQKSFESPMNEIGHDAPPLIEDEDKVLDRTGAGQGALIESVWLQPVSQKECILSIGVSQLSFIPSNNCLAKSAVGFERTFCPIKITPQQIMQRGRVKLLASGSCSGAINAIVSEQGFEVLANGG